MRSLRGRLTGWLLAGMGLLLTAGGLVLNHIIGAQLLRTSDAALTSRARSLGTLAEEEEDGKIWLEFSGEFMPEFERTEKPDYFQLWLRGGPVIGRSRSLGSLNLSRVDAPLGQPLLSDIDLPDGRRGRQVEISFRPRREELEAEEKEGLTPNPPSEATGDGPSVTLVVAHGREELDALLASVRVALTLTVLGLLGGTILLVKSVVGLSLAPLDNLARRLETIDAESLGQELPEAADLPAELVPVVQHLEELLARLEESFARERSFSANLAHELRTPLAELRAATEVALKWPDGESSELDVIAEIRGIGLQMERVVVNLLALARYDGKQHEIWPSEVSLRELAASCWSACAPEAEGEGIALQLEVPDDLIVVIDREKLALILSNLFSNAVAHGRRGSPVTCSAAMEGAEFVLRVGNQTDRLAAEDLPRMFDRFWRKDAARTDGCHAGLGLTLVAALCGLLGLEKEARLVGGTFEITLRGRALAALPPHPISSPTLHRGGVSFHVR